MNLKILMWFYNFCQGTGKSIFTKCINLIYNTNFFTIFFLFLCTSWFCLVDYIYSTSAGVLQVRQGKYFKI